MGWKNPRRTQRTAGCDAWKCDIVPQIKVSPSKATRLFSLLLLSVNNLSYVHTHTHIHTQKPSGHSLFKQHVPIKSLPPLPSPASPSLRAHITGLTDSAGAETLPQLWRSALVSNTDPCAISHRWLPFHAAW